MKTSLKHANPELFIGLTSATGTDLKIVSRKLEEQLKLFEYQVQHIHLIETLHRVEKWRQLPEAPVDDRLESHMNAGDEFRAAIESSAAIALLGVGNIRQQRRVLSGDTTGNQPIQRCAFALRGLKHPSEVNTLRDIYGEGFILIGVYSPHQARLEYLANRIAQSRNDFQTDAYRATAEKLMHRDQEETGNKFGQNVRDTFHRADVFVNASDPELLQHSLERFIDLLFGVSLHTPTRDEYGMFHAQASAFRSADLGRQVGAAIASDDGDIIAVGTNEVPKAGGGLYWAEDKPDQRDFVLGFDSNDRRKRNLLGDLLERLRTENWLAEDKKAMSTEDLVNLALGDGGTTTLRKTQLMNLIEFGRAVHAEMAALIDAARRGVSVKGSTLYCTTFPCHLCARHIVAAGIRRVVYIEPYPKSLAAQLYPDSIGVESHGLSDHQIVFEPFVGVAPRQYMKLFMMSEKRKDDVGFIISPARSTAVPRCQSSPPTYLRNEESELDNLNQIMMSKGLRKKTEATNAG